MAVKGPVHALLAVHLQASWNRLTREATRSRGAVVLNVLGLVLVGPLLLGALALLAFLGWKAGGHLGDPRVGVLLGTLLTVVPLGLGVMEGILGPGQRLPMEALRAFPVRGPSLVLAESVATLGSVPALLSGSLALAFFLGLAAHRPLMAPLALFWWTFGAALMAAGTHFAGALAGALLRRLRFLLVAFLLGVSLVPSLLNPPQKAFQRSREARAQAREARPGERRQVETLGRRALGPLSLLPGSQALRGGADLLEGRPLRALGRQLWPLAFLGLLGTGMGLLLGPARTQAFRRPARGVERLWSFRSPSGGVARLHLQAILRSYVGRFTLLLPLICLVMGRGMGGQGPWKEALVLPGMVVYTILGLNTLAYNAFGLDGPGIKALFLLPLEARDLLLGKAKGLALWAALLLVLVLAGTGLLLRPDPRALLAMVGLGAACFALHLAVGQWTSLWLPRRLPWDRMASNTMPGPVILVSMGVTVASVAVPGGAFALAWWLAPAWAAPIMLSLGAGLLSAYRYMALPVLAAYLDRRREALLLALEG